MTMSKEIQSSSGTPVPFQPEYLALPSWRRDAVLCWQFAKISALVLGGGYAIMAAAQEEFSRKRRWITDDEFLELVAITQTVPGILAVNFAVAIGWKVNRWRGAVAGLLGAVFPPLIIMTIVAMIMTQMRRWMELPAVQGAFRGLIAVVTAMVAAAVIKLRAKTVRCWFDLIVALGCCFGLLAFKYNPALLILGAVLLGMARNRLSARRRSGS